MIHILYTYLYMHTHIQYICIRYIYWTYTQDGKFYFGLFLPLRKTNEQVYFSTSWEEFPPLLSLEYLSTYKWS